MKNRYGDEYWWTQLSADEYLFEMTGSSLEYCRYGGHEGGGLDTNNLGMFDPSGGPYIAVGTVIQDRTITHIRKTPEGFVVTVAQ